MLTIIDKHANDLTLQDGDFAEIAGGKLAAFQKQALEQTSDLVPIHPGLAKFLKEKGMWDKAWDALVALLVVNYSIASAACVPVLLTIGYWVIYPRRYEAGEPEVVELDANALEPVAAGSGVLGPMR